MAATTVIVEGAPWWSGGLFALLGAVVGGYGTYLAQRRQDRRRRRADILTTFGNELDGVAREIKSTPDSGGDRLWKIGHEVWREALAVSAKDARLARRILETNVKLTEAVTADSRRTEATNTYNDYTYDGESLRPQIEAVTTAIEAYLLHLGRSIGSVRGRDATVVLSPRKTG